MHPMNRWIERFHNRVLWGEFLHRVADGLVIYLFVFGTAILAVRLTLPQFWPHVLWLAVGSIPVAAWAWWVAKKNLQPRQLTIAMLDQQLDAGGLLMTLAEHPDAKWNEQLIQFDGLWSKALPRFQPRRFVSFLTVPVLFLIGSCFVPLREAMSTPITPQAVASEATARLEQLKESLDQAQVLQEEEKQQIQNEIDKIQKEAQDTPLTHENWETLDALQERMQLRVNEAAAKSRKALNAIDRLAGLKDGTIKPINDQEKQQLEEDVEAAIEELMKKAKDGEKKLPTGKKGAVSPELQKKLEQLLKNGKPKLPSDPKERQELLEQLKQELQQQKEMLEELREQARERARERGEGEPGDEQGEGEQGQQPGEGQNGEQQGENGEGGDNQDGKEGQKPGKGGTSRGRGDAEMSWGDEADEKKLKFKEILLPPGFLDKPKEEVAGIKFIAPTDQAAAASEKRALQAGKTSLGETTWGRKLSPKHRNVVKQYFGDEKKK